MNFNIVKSQPDSLSGWLNYIENLHTATIELGLDRVHQVYQNLALDLSGSTIITVAGTNGKGSTCRFLEALARSLGKTTGVYSSPHIQDYRERFRYNESLVEEQQWCQAFSQVEAARKDDPLTYFEFGTLVALCMMARKQPDVIILEVGLGGRLDAVNIVDCDIAVVTSIGIDHQSWLGDTREQIAVEKAGIAREHTRCVVGEPDAPTTLQTELNHIGADVFWQGSDFGFDLQDNVWQFHSDIATETLWVSNLPYGPLLPQNISTALMTANLLGWPLQPDRLMSLVSEVSLPGRYERASDSPRILLDVAHNPQATVVLANRIAQEDFDNLFIVAGMLADKDSVASLQAFKGLQASWYVAPLDTSRSATTEVLKSALDFCHEVTECDSVHDAFSQVISSASEGDLILGFGSFYTVAELKSALALLR